MGAFLYPADFLSLRERIRRPTVVAAALFPKERPTRMGILCLRVREGERVGACAQGIKRGRREGGKRASFCFLRLPAFFPPSLGGDAITGPGANWFTHAHASEGYDGNAADASAVASMRHGIYGHGKSSRTPIWPSSKDRSYYVFVIAPKFQSRDRGFGDQRALFGSNPNAAMKSPSAVSMVGN